MKLKGKHFRYRKTGSFYAVMDVGKVQISAELKDGDEVVIYMNDAGDMFVRSSKEFTDGRFVEVHQ